MSKLVKAIICVTVDPAEWCSSPNYTALQNCVLSMSNLSGPYKINSEAVRSFEVTSVEVIENGN